MQVELTFSSLDTTDSQLDPSISSKVGIITAARICYPDISSEKILAGNACDNVNEATPASSQTQA